MNTKHPCKLQLPNHTAHCTHVQFCHQEYIFISDEDLITDSTLCSYQTKIQQVWESGAK